MAERKLKIGVLVSGRGTNLQAIIDAIEGGTLPAEIALVVSNRPGAMALERCARHNVPSTTILREDYRNRRQHQLAIARELKERGVELVVLAGFDRIVHQAFLDEFPMRIINIHPSLLPAFAGGLHAQRDALEYGVKLSGCTVHFATEAVDAGPIIVQAAVPVLDDDTVQTLSARILEQEHKMLPEAIRIIAAGRIRIEGRRVFTS